MRAPASLAARASDRFRSMSIVRWAAKEPAAARVVPRAEMKTVGAGSMVDKAEGHSVESELAWTWRIVVESVGLDGRGLRVRAWSWAIWGVFSEGASRLLRICEPFLLWVGWVSLVLDVDGGCAGDWWWTFGTYDEACAAD